MEWIFNARLAHRFALIFERFAGPVTVATEGRPSDPQQKTPDKTGNKAKKKGATYLP